MPTPSLRLLTRDNGVGLSRDLRLMAEGLFHAGLDCERVAFGAGGRSGKAMELDLWASRLRHGRIDVQVFLERVYPRCLPLAKRNVLVPNPEWLLDKWQPLLPRFDLVLCKTRHAQRLFEARGCPTAYLGFTSDDRRDVSVARERAFFHLAGSSASKGTEVLLAAWRQHPEWPRLTVVQAERHARRGPAAPNIEHHVGYLDDSALRWMQNRHVFHVCPSEVEGYGHHLVEAMSVGAVVLATDAAPMNEHVTPDRGILIRASPGRRQGLDTTHEVTIEAIERAVDDALCLAGWQRAAMGEAARTHFLAGRRAFHARLQASIPMLLGEAAAGLAAGCAS
ncbi:glycosyltransferase [Pseudoxanthomonas sp. LjRoot125]|uniref:glycosyltransferase n=1 Tax=Pseudoxanthomonas sp. LjRoot125 TaxID=3342258 RepID=UPI003E122397